MSTSIAAYVWYKSKALLNYCYFLIKVVNLYLLIVVANDIIQYDSTK